MNSAHQYKSLRCLARQTAVQAIYQWQLVGTPMLEIEQEFIAFYIKKKINLPYFREIIHGVVAQKNRIEELITPFLQRKITDIDSIELAILRIASYEMIARSDIPYRVIINEGLQLAKKFGSFDSYKFINSILDKVARITRAQELC